jgi:hypothetical protein
MVLRANTLAAGIGPGAAERAGEIPVRMTLIWEFGPGTPARWLRMNTNRYATHCHGLAFIRMTPQNPEQTLR